jgi:hypothetical protein
MHNIRETGSCKKNKNTCYDPKRGQSPCHISIIRMQEQFVKINAA